MPEINFYETAEVDDSLLEFAVIVSQYKDKWIFCKHKDRDTYEIPGGHRESNETIIETARRELFEETGATKFSLIPISVYSVKTESGETFGFLYFAEVEALDSLPPSEIEKIGLFTQPPERLTYPLIQPKLMKKVLDNIK